MKTSREYFDINGHTEESTTLFKEVTIKNYIGNIASVDEEELTSFLNPVFNKEIISRRQEATKFIIQEISKDKKEYSNFSDVVRITKDLKNKNNYSNKTDLRVFVPVFDEVVRYLRNMSSKLDKNSHTKIFAAELAQVLNTPSNIAKHSNLLGVNSLIYLESRNENNIIAAANVEEPKRVSSTVQYDVQGEISSGLVNLMKEFFDELYPILCRLRPFMDIANYYNQRKKLNEHIIFPDINNNGRLHLLEADPLALSKNPHENITNLVRFNLDYTRDNNHFIYSGAHSGGKTQRLKDIGIYHILAMAGLPIPAKEGDIHLIEKIVTYIDRENFIRRNARGSLEEEIAQTIKKVNTLGDDSIFIIDEFLDTTKPELAKYLALPLIQMLDKSKSAIHITFHAANSLYNAKTKFRFMYPEIKHRMVPEYKLVECPDSYYCDYEKVQTGKNKRYYYPTYKFLEGLPNAKVTQKHAKQLWETAIDRIR